MDVLLLLSFLLGQGLYNGVITYFNRENKKPKLKRYITFINEMKIVYHIITRKLHGLAPRYNLKQKYITLISSYNLKREDYKEKHNLLTLDLSLDARLQNWEGFRHPTYLGKPIF